ncbi:MAG: peroxiredoxin family protein [Verrucomicrobia bacterium]|nr:peroxiredoxin family protein [Verrucomicrobiota bacterium]
MKTLLAALLMLGAAALARAEVTVGKLAPDFVAKDVTGKTHRLSDYRGKIVVLEAYNLDCPFCANHYKTGAMQALQASVTSKGGIWLVVNSTAQKQSQLPRGRRRPGRVRGPEHEGHRLDRR